jgi:hypothetical protein
MARQPRQPKSEEHYNEQETVRRRDEAVRRALNTPPKPLKDMVAERKAKRGSDKEPRR